MRWGISTGKSAPVCSTPLRTGSPAGTCINGAFGGRRGNELYLTLDARYNYEAYQALNGHAGTVTVYNYKTGEILCMVSAPSYDPLNVPADLEENDRYEGAYLNRFLSATFVPGSVFKTVTLTAALETLPERKAGHGTAPARGNRRGNRYLLRHPRGADPEGGLCQLLQRGLCPDCGGIGADTLKKYTEGGADRRLLRGRPAHRQRLL